MWKLNVWCSLEPLFKGNRWTPSRAGNKENRKLFFYVAALYISCSQCLHMCSFSTLTDAAQSSLAANDQGTVLKVQCSWSKKATSGESLHCTVMDHCDRLVLAEIFILKICKIALFYSYLFVGLLLNVHCEQWWMKTHFLWVNYD